VSCRPGNGLHKNNPLPGQRNGRPIRPCWPPAPLRAEGINPDDYREDFDYE